MGIWGNQFRYMCCPSSQGGKSKDLTCVCMLTLVNRNLIQKVRQLEILERFWIQSGYTGWSISYRNIYCKSRNLPSTDTQNYSADLRYLLVHPVHTFGYGLKFGKPGSKIPSVQEVVPHFIQYIMYLYKMGHHFLDIQYIRNTER